MLSKLIGLILIIIGVISFYTGYSFFCLPFFLIGIGIFTGVIDNSQSSKSVFMPTNDDFDCCDYDNYSQGSDFDNSSD